MTSSQKEPQKEVTNGLGLMIRRNPSRNSQIRNRRALLFFFLPFLLDIFCCGTPRFSLKHRSRLFSAVESRLLTKKRQIYQIHYCLSSVPSATDNHGHLKEKTKLRSTVSETVQKISNTSLPQICSDKQIITRTSRKKKHNSGPPILGQCIYS